MKRVSFIFLLLIISTVLVFASGTKASSVAVDPDKPYAGAKITWLTAKNANVSAVYDNLGDTPWAKYVMEQTGIEIEFISYDISEMGDKIAQMKALGSLPDIIEYKWGDYAGGPTAAIRDKVIIDLTPYMEENAPNLIALMSENPDVDKVIRTNGGKYYCFPFLRGLTQPNITQFSSCFVIRQDILDELGLERPETIDEWETVLRAFKEYGFEEPFVTRGMWLIDVWSPAYDNWGDFYIDDGTVKNGLVEDSRYQVISKLHQWYEEGLIESDWMNSEKKSNEADFTSEKAGAAYAPIGQGLGNYTTLMADKGITSDDIRATVPVTSEKGRNATFSKMNQIFDDSGYSAAISTKCKNIEAAMWLLDWMYSEEGNLCCNYGIPGVSYVMKDGVPMYTETVTKNPDMTMATALAIYTRASTSGVCVQDEDYIRQYYYEDNQKEALELSLRTDMASHFFPPATVSEENTKAFSEIMGNVSSYSEEMEEMFITGQAELNETTWNNYIKNLRDMGIEEAMAMMQDAYDEYQTL